ncbi:MAG TPA: di-heme-cytochrome C peroxidase [Bryobacteraceae bacterium]|nr:di-heme-cytochrome C peroxidase [Bryobacteraceae bacterium]
MRRKNAVSLCLLALAASMRLLSQTAAPACMAAWPKDVAGCLDQNWTNQMRDQFWFIDQGSRLMPLEWFLRLEKAASTEKFAAGLDRYGFVTDSFNLPGSINQAGLPIGLAVGKSDGDPADYVGLTCAACHSGKIAHNGKAYMIEGAPAMLDFDHFLADLVDAMTATQADTQKWARFAAGQPQANLKKDFDARTAKLVIRHRINTPTPEAGPAGFGRVDAFGHIFNQVVVDHLGNPESNSKPPNAPASYPALWDVAQHPFVQWNYSAPNLGVGGEALGSLLRNIGEVLGVFGTIDIKTGGVPRTWTYRSSANLDNLKKIEAMVLNLRSPAWPFDERIDPAARDAGQLVYVREQCHTCHALIDAKNPPNHYPAYQTPIADVRTDSDLDDNFQHRTAPTGRLKGAPKGALIWAFPVDPLSLTSFGSQDLVKNMTVHLALNVLPSKSQQALAGTLGVAANVLAGATPRYKARPLNGIWATAPYLHNGSVPNLTELLKDENSRIARFCIGDGEYDVENVGYRTYADLLASGQGCPNRTTMVDTSRNGSHRQGHNYGTGLSDADKRNLIEFLKSL